MKQFNPDSENNAFKKFSLVVLVCCTTLAFALGWLTPKAIGYWQAEKHAQPQAASTVLAAASPESGAAANALSRFKAIDWNTEAPAGAKELVSALPGDAPLRMAALERYRQEPAGLAKDNLVQLLTAQPLPEISAAAAVWAQQSDNAMARADGFRLLIHLPPEPSTYRLARQALEHEKDPAALAAAVWAMVPLGIPDPADVQQVVPRLHALTQHPLANVRAASIQRLAEWDRAKLHTTQDVLRLMSDPDADVRLAALGASSIAALTSDSVKQRLFVMLGSAEESSELRSIVLWQLDRFGLSPQEYATYQAVQRELFGKANGQ